MLVCKSVCMHVSIYVHARIWSCLCVSGMGVCVFVYPSMFVCVMCLCAHVCMTMCMCVGTGDHASAGHGQKWVSGQEEAGRRQVA